MSARSLHRTSGHGWVIPRSDGAHVRCGGPAICGECRAEQGDLDARGVDVVWAVALAPGMVMEDGREVKVVNGREVTFSDGSTEQVTWLPVRRDGQPPSDPEQMVLDELRGTVGEHRQDVDQARKSWSQVIDQMIKAHAAGISMARIGNEVGLTRERVRQIIGENTRRAV